MKKEKSHLFNRNLKFQDNVAPNVALRFQKDVLTQEKKLKDQLSTKEQEEFRGKINTEVKTYEDKAARRFDSNKNWSIMIKPQHNDVRNEIMRRVKSNQSRRRELPNFERTTKEQILNSRPKP